MSPLRIAVICDLREEGWPSMDLAADMLLQHLQSEHGDCLTVERIQPAARRRFSRRKGRAWRWTMDRFLNRFWDYPRHLRARRHEFDLYHIVDHSYSQLVHALPADRTIVTCHDLDTFRSSLRPDRDGRSLPFRMMTRRILAGFVRASRIVCVSETTRDELISSGLVPIERVTVVHNGVHPSCTPVPDEGSALALEALIGQPPRDGVELLHVGSTIPRKRIDLLLEVVAELRGAGVPVRLLRAGGPFTSEQERQAGELGLEGDVVVLPPLSRPVLSELYRRANLLLQTSEQEGFGLPVVEALACGTPAVVSDIPIMREVAGSAVTYCSITRPGEWCTAVIRLLAEKQSSPADWEARRKRGIERASRFSWAAHAREMVKLYDAVAACGSCDTDDSIPGVDGSGT